VRAGLPLLRLVAAEAWDGDQQVERAAELVQPPRVPADERLPLLVGKLGEEAEQLLGGFGGHPRNLGDVLTLEPADGSDGNKPKT